MIKNLTKKFFIIGINISVKNYQTIFKAKWQKNGKMAKNWQNGKKMAKFQKMAKKWQNGKKMAKFSIFN